MANQSHSRIGWALPFFTIWAGQALSLLGSSLVQFALVWWLTEQTGSATVLALATLAATLPRIVLGPLAGALVDRWNRRTVMIAADSSIALVTVALALLFAAGAVHTWHIYVAMLLRAAGGGFHWPAMQASTSLMVPERHLARVAGLNQTLNGAMTIAAPPLGALLLALLPLQGVLAIDVITAAMAVTTLALTAVPQPERPAGRAMASVREDFAAGLRYVWAWPGLRALLVLAMAINFCLFPAFSLLPILVTGRFDGGAAELGWMQSASGAGLLLGGIVLGAWGGFQRRIVTSMIGLIGMGLGFLTVGLTPESAFGLALAAVAWSGAMEAMHGGPLFAAIQATVDPAMQGRVLSLIASLTAAVVPVSLALAGPLADALGIGVWYMLSGGACILLGLTAFSIAPLMQLEAGSAAAEPDAVPAI